MREHGNVYFILQTSKITDEKYYKIGYSTDPEKRVRELKTGNPNTLELKYIIENVPSSFEKHMHLICDRYRVDGEWFKDSVINFLLCKSSPWFKENMIHFPIGDKEKLV